jgi:hypothetical protein
VGRLNGRIRSVVPSPEYATDRVLYAVTVEGVFRSNDGGESWTPTEVRIEFDVEGAETDPAALVAMSPNYGVDGTVFAGTDSLLFVTRDHGSTWTAVQGGTLAESSRVLAVAVSPDYEQDGTVLVSVQNHGLLRSTDDGGTSPVGSELYGRNRLIADFNNPTSAPIQFSPTYATDHTIFAYAQQEVLRSGDGGDTWEVLGLPRASDLLPGDRPRGTARSFRADREAPHRRASRGRHRVRHPRRHHIVGVRHRPPLIADLGRGSARRRAPPLGRGAATAEPIDRGRGVALLCGAAVGCLCWVASAVSLVASPVDLARHNSSPWPSAPSCPSWQSVVSCPSRRS